jgi:hypothetical protein
VADGVSVLLCNGVGEALGLAVGLSVGLGQALLVCSTTLSM